MKAVREIPFAIVVATIVAALGLWLWTPEPSIEPDIKSFHEFGRSATMFGTRMQIGATRYFAASGPVRYDDFERKARMWHLFHRSTFEDMEYVVFQRDFSFEDISISYADKHVGDISRYDDKHHRIVFFVVGNEYAVQLK